MSEPIIEIRGVRKEYHVGGGDTEVATVSAVDPVDLTISRGEFLALVGPSGCGKSTLLNMIGGLLVPSAGEIRVEREPITGPHPKITMVFQEVSVFPWRSTMENVEFGLEVQGVPREARRARCQEIIDMVGLRGFEDRYPAELSGGMNQRVAIARALALNPHILLMDEPFGALDEQTRMLLGEELLRIWEKLQQTIVFVTHNISEAVQLADRVLVMSARPGRIRLSVRVELPRPRDSAVIGSPLFSQLVGEIWGVLREEAQKALRYSDDPTTLREGGK